MLLSKNLKEGFDFLILKRISVLIGSIAVCIARESSLCPRVEVAYV